MLGREILRGVQNGVVGLLDNKSCVLFIAASIDTVNPLPWKFMRTGKVLVLSHDRDSLLCGLPLRSRRRI
jgi:hypothetical protein